MAPPSYLPNGIWSNHHCCDEMDRLKQSNQIHKGVCFHSGLSRLQPAHSAERTQRISSLTRRASPLLWQGKGTISSLFYTDFNTSHCNWLCSPSTLSGEWTLLTATARGAHQNCPGIVQDGPPWRPSLEDILRKAHGLYIQCKTLQQ